MFTFITSLRHPQNANSWDHILDLLDRTLDSVFNQTTDDFKVIVVYNKGSRLRSSHPNLIYHPVDLPPNPSFMEGSSTEEGRASFRLDRGQKVLAGLYCAQSFIDMNKPSHVMMFDADDCVSSRLVEFASQFPQHDGWYVDQGYLFQENGHFAYHLEKNFSKICGTCYVVRYDAFNLPEHIEDVSQEFIIRALGSHIFLKDILAEKGTVLTPLPFIGAVYMIGHGDNHGKIPGYRTLVDGYDGGSRGWRGALRLLTHLHPLTPSLRREFGLYPLGRLKRDQ